MGGTTNLKICYWSIGNGAYEKMLQTLVSSARNCGVSEDFHFFIESDLDIKGATIHRISPFEKGYYIFKYDILLEYVSKLDYDVFIFLDADNYFVRNPGNLSWLVEDTPLHVSFERLLSTDDIHSMWWGLQGRKISNLIREYGVSDSKSIYSVNAGFWILRKEFIKEFYNSAIDFWNYSKQRGFLFTEEPPLAYVSHLVTNDIERHHISNLYDVWASDWAGIFVDSLPVDKKWPYFEPFGSQMAVINPAIVHAMRSKKALIKEANNVMEQK